MNPLDARLCPWLGPLADRWSGERLQSHGLVIQGTRGMGKLNLALFLAARWLGSPASTERLGPSDVLAGLNLNTEETQLHPDLHWLKPKKAGGSIGVDEVRQLSQELALTPMMGQAKVALIEPAEAMTVAACNALLKTLEEPSGAGYLVLVSHRSGSLPATILSRCAHITVPDVPQDTALAWLTGHGGLSDQDWLKLLSVSPGPLRALTLAENNFLNNIKKIEEDIQLIYNSQLDPLEAATRWAKGDPGMNLEWMVSQLEQAIRRPHQASNPVTVLEGPTLHNAFDQMTLRSKFELLDRVRGMAGSIGTGLNVEQSFKSLLLSIAEQGQGRHT